MNEVAALLDSMELDARIAQLNQRLKGWECVTRGSTGWRVTDTLRREVETLGGIGAIYGLFRADPWSGVTEQTAIQVGERAEVAEVVSDYVVHHSAHPIAPLLVEEAPHGLMAVGGQLQPTNLGLAAGWNPDAVEQAARFTALELRESGAHLALVSGLDVVRDPRWGRSEETYGEDPRAAEWFIEAVLRGYAAVDGVGVVVKHFAGQGAGAGGRNASGAPIGRRELAELHLLGARRAVRAGAVGVMAAYNEIDGLPCIADRWLLTELLRDRWGFEGIVMADGGAVDRLTRVTGSPAASAAAALHAGVDLSLWDEAYTELHRAVDLGLADERDVARAAKRVLGVKQRLGLLSAASSAPAPEPDWRVDADRLAGRLAAEAIVMVKGHVGQLVPAQGNVAVVGPNADDALSLLGDYTPPRPNEPGIAGVLAARPGWEQRVRHGGSGARSGTRWSVQPDDLSALAGAHTAVVVLGDTSERLYASAFADNGAAIAGDIGSIATCGEGFDVADLDLPAAQLELLRAARRSAGQVIAIVISGRARAIGPVLELADAVLYAPYPGPGGAAAIADVLLGHTLPTGRLPVSLPRDPGTVPVNHNDRIESVAGYLDQSAPSGTWGYGSVPLGTGAALVRINRLAADSATVSAGELLAGGAARIRIELTNLIDRELDHSLLLFGRRQFGLLTPRRAELLALTRVHLGPGEQRSVLVDLGPEQLFGVNEYAEPVIIPERVRLAASGPGLDDPAAPRVDLILTQ